MVAFVGGAGLGLFNTSLNVVGDAASRGTALTGRSGERTYVNTSTGNLVVQRQDEYLAAAGADIAILRTYNSQGLMTDDNGDNWRMGVAKTLGSYVAGASVTRTDGDGAVLVYTWDGGSYVNKQGDGAFDTLAFNGSTWTWTDGSTGSTETYDWSGGSGKLIRSADNNGNATVYGYGGLNGSLVTSITSASGEVTSFDYYSGTANLQALRTVKADGTIIRVGYEYTSNRLTAVNVDITPADGVMTDGNRYRTDYSYDADGNVIKVVDARGNATVHTYDSKGNRLSTKDAAGNYTERTYNGANQLLTETRYLVPDPDGVGPLAASSPLTSRYAYDQNNNLRFAVSADGRVTEYQYNHPKKLLTATIQYTGDLYTGGTVSESTLVAWAANLADKSRSTRVDNSYDFRGNLQTSTRYAALDATGAGVAATASVTSYIYDQSGQLLQTTSANGNQSAAVGDGTSYYLFDGLWRNYKSIDTLGNVSLVDFQDAASRSVTTAANNLVATSTYNAAGDLVSVQQANGSAVIGTTRYWYDAAGRLIAQSQRDCFGASKARLEYYYDGGGRMSLYKLFQSDGSMTDYTTVYNSGDATRVDSITANRGSGPAITYNNYDSNGFIASVTTSGSANRANARTLANDVQGRVLQKIQDGHTTRSLIVNGEVIGSSSDSAAPVADTFASNYMPIASETLAQGPSAYTVQVGDTLQSIAKNVWGNANFWYLIADANGTTTVTNGQVITIPGKTNTIANDYQTFTPYSQGKAVGDTTPILPAPNQKTKWWKQVLAIVIEAVATFLGGPVLGNIVGQMSRQVMGIQDEFNFKSVGMSVLSQGINAGLDQVIPGDSWLAGKDLPQAAARAAIANTATQGIAVVTGMQSQFSWRSVAASAAGAAVGQAVAPGFANAFGKDSFAARFATGFTAGAAVAVARGGRVSALQVAADAFGNALSSSLADAPRPADTSQLPTGDFARMDRANDPYRQGSTYNDMWREANLSRMLAQANQTGVVGRLIDVAGSVGTRDIAPTMDKAMRLGLIGPDCRTVGTWSSPVKTSAVAGTWLPPLGTSAVDMIPTPTGGYGYAPALRSEEPERFFARAANTLDRFTHTEAGMLLQGLPPEGFIVGAVLKPGLNFLSRAEGVASGLDVLIPEGRFLTSLDLPSSSVNAANALSRKLSAMENALATAASSSRLADGRILYYGEEIAARTAGPTRGASLVTEHNPATGTLRQYYESYDWAGNAVRVHPKMIDGQVVTSPHFPPTGAELGR